MTKWKRYKRGIYYLQGKNHTAIVSKWPAQKNPTHWTWGVYEGVARGMKIKRWSMLARDAGSRASAEMYACKRLLEIEQPSWHGPKADGLTGGSLVDG
jgi:hypothetical protein